MSARAAQILVAPWRRYLLLGTFGLALAGLLARAFYIQVWARDFYRRYGDRQQIRTAVLPAHRGRLLDRQGVPLALSAPVKAVCINPRRFHAEPGQLHRLARLLGMRPQDLEDKIETHRRQAFLYLKRQLAPALAERVLALDLDGLFLRPEFRRYYPAAEVTAHLLGFTDIDQHGQEGLERRFDTQLTGMAGRVRVIRDRKGRLIEAVESLQAPRPGHDVRLSIDRRLQYWAYLELKRAVARHHAKAGMLVLLDARTGEVLALANQPTFNPNLRDGRRRAAWRNRAVTDVFEPGSTLKPFAMACALREGVARIGERIDTAPGWLRVGRHVVRDHHRHDVLDLTGILVKSSNVGITQVALRLSPGRFTACLRDFGFGESCGIEFPGEAGGFVPVARGLGRFEQATLAFGYGLNVSTLQLARAYTALADDGVLHSLTLLPRTTDPQACRVLPAGTARQVRRMLEGVVTPQGTARRARVPGYRVAGKTGTAKVAVPGGYAKDRYRALFVGMAPASAPRLVLAVVIEEPRGKEYYGGQVAAPVFSRVMGLALRLLGIPPDEVPAAPPLLARAGGRL
ncbi:cell division protein FtsI [Methylomarinovum tepidoasis]|uniref:Peptidoglycan D,D-transpeptidase FtsI n=1 Tax=Methylomarinovum tepidoasis TaxID=2840183 RepID=A0AAU9CFJ7_9GAMM|nr:penicillin-binding protein 2 [Methylomarinovum sp. IN45]BCX88026.1 cell division protein FtsI [Methylomarinovum sp. IN45]